MNEPRHPNFFAVEYADQVREEAEYALAYLKHLERMIQNPANISQFPRIQEYEELVSRGIHWLTIELLDLLSARTTRKLMKNALHIKAYLTFNLNICLKDLYNLVTQRTRSHFPVSEYLRKIHVENVRPYVYNSIDNALRFFMRCYFGDKFKATLACMTELTGDFRVRPIELHRKGILTVEVPEVNITRTRLWSGLAHEAAHHRLSMIPGMQKVDNLFEELSEELQKIGWRHVPKIYKSFEIVEWLSYLQYQEMLADISSVMVIGPASIFGLLCYSPPVAYDTFFTHPPLPVRVHYAFELLQSVVEESTDCAKELQDLRRSWDLYYRNFGAGEAHRDMVEEYLSVLRDSYQSDLFEVVRESIVVGSHINPFNEETWGKISDAIENKQLEKLGPVELVNVPLYRRWKSYPEMLKSERTPLLYRSYEKKLTCFIMKRFAELHP